jgi:hypothetical protein
VEMPEIEIFYTLFKKETDPHFDPKEFDLIKEKWTKLLELQEKSVDHKIELIMAKDVNCKEDDLIIFGFVKGWLVECSE